MDPFGQKLKNSKLELIHGNKYLKMAVKLILVFECVGTWFNITILPAINSLTISKFENSIKLNYAA